MWSSVLVRLARYECGGSNVRWCFPELLEKYLHDIPTVENAKKMFQYVQRWRLSEYKINYSIISAHSKRQMPRSFTFQFHLMINTTWQISLCTDPLADSCHELGYRCYLDARSLSHTGHRDHFGLNTERLLKAYRQMTGVGLTKGI